MSQIQLETEKIGFREKASFALANLGNIPIMALIGGYLMIFYTDIVGLNPTSVATLFLITRVLDGLNDPVMGYIIDHLPRTKLGRFRTYLLIGVVICSVNYMLLWFGPAWVPAGKLVVAYISYVLIGITFDLMDIPLNSMIPAMTADEKERASLSTIKGVFYMIGTVIFSVGAPLVISALGASLPTYYILVFTAIAIVLICTIIGVRGIRERVEPIQDEPYKLKDIFGIIRLRPILSTFLTTLLFGISGAISGSSNIYFATYVLDNRVEILSLTTILSVVGMVPSLSIAGWLIGKIGKKNLFTIALIIGCCSPLLRLVNVTSIPLMLVSSVISGFTLGFGMVLIYNVQADNVDYVEYATNRRAEGGIASLYSFITKAGGGIGGAISGYILAATGYVANQVQTDTARFGIITNVLILPVVLYLAACFVFGFGYNITTEKLAEISATLRERREEKARAEQSTSAD